MGWGVGKLVDEEVWTYTHTQTDRHRRAEGARERERAVLETIHLFCVFRLVRL